MPLMEIHTVIIIGTVAFIVGGALGIWLEHEPEPEPEIEFDPFEDTMKRLRDMREKQTITQFNDDDLTAIDKKVDGMMEYHKLELVEEKVSDGSLYGDTIKEFIRKKK